MITSYTLLGFPVSLDTATPTTSTPSTTSTTSTKTNISTHNLELPHINKCKENYVDVSDNKVESLLEQQIVLLKLILLFLGFFILSNVFKKN